MEWESSGDTVSSGELRRKTSLTTKRRRWGRFMGLRGCETPTVVARGGGDGEEEEKSVDDMLERMEREWKRARERAEEERRAEEKGWRGRW